MANHSSSKKAIRQIAKRTAVNKNTSSRIKTYIKKAQEAINSASNEEAIEAVRKAQSEISKGVTKGIFKKNTASRKVSCLVKKLASE